MADYIFHDPTGRRDRRARLGAGLLVSLAALIVAGFFATLAFAPLLPQLSLKDPHVLQALHVETAHRLRGKPAWTHVPRRPNAGAPGGPSFEGRKRSDERGSSGLGGSPSRRTRWRARSRTGSGIGAAESSALV